MRLTMKVEFCYYEKDLVTLFLNMQVMSNEIFLMHFILKFHFMHDRP
jgi:hypothetical protein